ncbi:MAG TPA: hypothetical protein DEF42_15710 [Desulfosporosinus sp.]|nr:hypothetical protein [Desulfosporosinus sp.]
MDVNSISAPSSLKAPLLNKFKIGERLLVEVVHKHNEGEGTVRVKGQTMSALLETSTQVGEKFWVKVGHLNESGVLLIREPLLGKTENSSAPQPAHQLTERGLPNSQEIIVMVKSFPTSNLGVFSSFLGSLQGATLTDELIMNLRKAIPQWDSLSDDHGFEKLLASLRKLGLNYEQRILQMLKMDHPDKEMEKTSLKETFKGRLLAAIHSQEGDLDSNSPLAQLLQKITGQQLWFKTGAMDTAYMLLHLPLLNQEQFIPVQIAIESARKGLKMDEQHCRIAILIETQELGEIGIDSFFNEDSFTCRVLSQDLQFIPQLLEEVLPETRVKFAKLGFNIERVEVGELKNNLEFQNFLKGSRRSGVDVSR